MAKRPKILLVYWHIPCQEYAKELADYIDTFSSDLRKVALKEGEGVDRIKEIKEKEEGVVQLFNAGYMPAPCGHEECTIDCIDGYARILAGFPRSNPALGNYLSTRSLEEYKDRIHVIEEHPSKHPGKLSIRVTVFPELRAKCGKVWMEKGETKYLLRSLIYEFEEYMRGRRV